MSTWRTVGSVVAGTLVTVVTVTMTLVLLPFLGFGAAELVGDWLPIWLFLLPVALAAVLGGATTGVLSGRTPSRSAVLGCLATATGLASIGAVVGLLFLVFMLGMIPAHGQETDLAAVTGKVVALGGVVGFVAGAVCGAIGGASGHIGRQNLES